MCHITHISLICVLSYYYFDQAPILFRKTLNHTLFYMTYWRFVDF